jgi:hypothetical protein
MEPGGQRFINSESQFHAQIAAVLFQSTEAWIPRFQWNDGVLNCLANY